MSRTRTESPESTTSRSDAVHDLKRVPPTVFLPGMVEEKQKNKPAESPKRKQPAVEDAEITGRPFAFWHADEKAKSWQKHFGVLAHRAIESADVDLFQLIVGPGPEWSDELTGPVDADEVNMREQLYRNFAIHYLTKLISRDHARDYTFEALFHAIEGMKAAQPKVEERKRVNLSSSGELRDSKKASQFLQSELPPGFASGQAYIGVDSFWDSVAQELIHLNFIIHLERNSVYRPSVPALRQLTDHVTINAKKFHLQKPIVISVEEKEIFPADIILNALLICQGIPNLRIHIAKYENVTPGGAPLLQHYFLDGKKFWEEAEDAKIQASYQDDNVVHLACHADTLQFIPLHKTPANAPKEVVVQAVETCTTIAPPASPKRQESVIAIMVADMLDLRIGEIILDGVRDLRFERTLLHTAIRQYWFIFAFHPTSLFDSSLERKKNERLAKLNTMIKLCLFHGINYYAQDKTDQDNRLTPYVFAEREVVFQSGKPAPEIDLGVHLNWLEYGLVAVHHLTDLSKRVGRDVLAYLPTVREKEASFFSICYHRKIRRERMPNLELLVGSLYEASYLKSDFNLKAMLERLRYMGGMTHGVLHASGLKRIIEGISVEIADGKLEAHCPVSPFEIILAQNALILEREVEQVRLRFLASGEHLKEKDRADKAEEEKRKSDARADKAEEKVTALAEEVRLLREQLSKSQSRGQSMPAVRPVIHLDLSASQISIPGTPQTLYGAVPINRVNVSSGAAASPDGRYNHHG